MYKQKISITINSDFEREKLFDVFVRLMGNFCNTGQIIGGVESSYVIGNEIVAYQNTMEKDSFDKKYNDKWVGLRINDLQEWCNSELKTEVVGGRINFCEDVCKCDHYDSFTLFTTYLNGSSPIECGICSGRVPIYRLTALTDEDRSDIMSWIDAYIACDELNMGCMVGEKWATKQMSDPASQLSISGKAICNRIMELTGIPTYYYLYNYRRISVAKDTSRKCPSCNGEWLSPDNGSQKEYDFRCDNCRLVSIITSNN